MFHQGTLQQGIAKAVQDSKSVVCFVTDNGPESGTWEQEWMQDQNLPSSIERHAIALRLEAGSQEAAFLAAFCPVSDTPTIVVIYKGQLQDQLKPGITKNDFTLRLLRSINRSQAAPPVAAAAVPPPPRTASSSAPQHSTASSSTSPPTPAQPSSPQPVSQPTSTSTSATTPETPSSSNSPPRVRRPNERSYAEQQTQRKREAKAERERILRIIENDKIERRERKEQRRRDAQAQVHADANPSASIDTDAARQDDMLSSTISPQSSKNASASTHSIARIQVRLTDGSTLRTTFPSETLLSAVRTWIDSNRTDGKTLYTLKQILTPHPSRALSNTENAQTLADLNLAPSAALVMVTLPTKSARLAPLGAVPGVERGSIGAGRDALTRLWVGLVALLMYLVAGVKTFLGLGLDADAAQHGPPGGPAAARATETRRPVGPPGATEQSSVSSGNDAAPGSARGGGIRIRTLRDQRRIDANDSRDVPSEFYNGNQLNFEPRDRDGDKEDESGAVDVS